MLTIGCHLSKRRGYLEMAKEAASINANTFQYFTRSPRGSEQAPLDEKDAESYLAFIHEHGIRDVLAYAPYDTDPATAKMSERDFALMVYAEDLAQLAELEGGLYLVRPGSRLGIGAEEGLIQVADALNKGITPSQTTLVLLDTIPEKEGAKEARITMLPVAKVFAQAIERIYADKPVSPLFS